jgi:hypothetical protein
VPEVLNVVPPLSCVFHDNVTFIVNGTGFLTFEKKSTLLQLHAIPEVAKYSPRLDNFSQTDIQLGESPLGTVDWRGTIVDVRKRDVRTWEQFSFTIGQNDFSETNLPFWAPNFTVHLPAPAEDVCQVNGQSPYTILVFLRTDSVLSKPS